MLASWKRVTVFWNFSPLFLKYNSGQSFIKLHLFYFHAISFTFIDENKIIYVQYENSSETVF